MYNVQVPYFLTSDVENGHWFMSRAGPLVEIQKCCGTVRIYCGSASNLGKVSVQALLPFTDPEPDPDHI
jgi:hypothetical protein